MHRYSGVTSWSVRLLLVTSLGVMASCTGTANDPSEAANTTLSTASETTIGEAPSAIETTLESTLATSETIPKELTHRPSAVVVAYDAGRNEARPLNETVVPITANSDVLAMKITGFSYRGVICGFSITGDAPPSPLTIRQFVRTPAGTFDSGPIDVTWKSLADDSVTAGTGQSGTWNFNAEAHVNRSGPGWVVSIGGVTPSIGDDETDAIPTDGGCELRSAKKVFTTKVGPIGYWAGFAVA
jgi:hypothetical protein